MLKPEKSPLSPTSAPQARSAGLMRSRGVPSASSGARLSPLPWIIAPLVVAGIAVAIAFRLGSSEKGRVAASKSAATTVEKREGAAQAAEPKLPDSTSPSTSASASLAYDGLEDLERRVRNWKEAHPSKWVTEPTTYNGQKAETVYLKTDATPEEMVYYRALSGALKQEKDLRSKGIVRSREEVERAIEYLVQHDAEIQDAKQLERARREFEEMKKRADDEWKKKYGERD